jgi:hypothetical protein
MANQHNVNLGKLEILETMSSATGAKKLEGKGQIAPNPNELSRHGRRPSHKPAIS